MANTTPQEAARLMAVADGAQGTAGHRVTDPAAREILRQQAADEITGDEARRLLIAAGCNTAPAKHSVKEGHP